MVYLLAAREADGKPACMLIPALSAWGWSWVTPTQAVPDDGHYLASLASTAASPSQHDKGLIMWP